MSALSDPGLDLVYLMACALHQTAPEETIVSSMNLDELYRLSARHSVSMIACSALQRCSRSEPLPDCWTTHCNNALRKAILLDAERKIIFQELESHGIWYCPLKGYILQNYYPGLGLREMSDTDILFDPACQETVRDCFVRRGYSVKSFAIYKDDTYIKPPVFNFEMHRTLFESGRDPELFSYWSDISSRLQRMNGTKFGRVMTPEDFYLYFLAHSYNHFSSYGTGLRTLSDCWVLLRQQEASMDRAYLDQELRKMNLCEFEQQLRLLAHSVFDVPCRRPALSADQEELLYYLLECGTYGLYQNKLVRIIRNSTDQLESEGLHNSMLIRFRYLWMRLFPTLDQCQKMPTFTPYSNLPFGRVRFIAMRITRVLPQYRKEVLMELKLLFRK